MGESVSTAGHGPTSGYSGMNAHLDNYLKSHPAHSDESKSRSRSLGPRSSDYKSHKTSSTTAMDKDEEAALALLAYFEEARGRMDKAISTIKDGLAIFRNLRAGRSSP